MNIMRGCRDPNRWSATDVGNQPRYVISTARDAPAQPMDNQDFADVLYKGRVGVAVVDIFEDDGGIERNSAILGFVAKRIPS